MENNLKEQLIYHYVDGNIQEKEKFRLKKEEIYYYRQSKSLNRDSPLVVGITRFKKEKKKKDILYIGNKTYRIDAIEKTDRIDGFMETLNGEYVAFYKENIFIYLLLPFLCMLIISILVPFTNKKIPNNEPANTEKWVVGGIEGTDVSLVPEKETQYNVYWGYQEITIDKTMKVPFINKDTNTSYAQFVLYNKEGNLIWQSVLIKPGSRDEWDAYSYYKGKSGSYFHDLKVIFYNPVYENDEIVDFIPSMFAATTPDFAVHIK